VPKVPKSPQPPSLTWAVTITQSQHPCEEVVQRRPALEDRAFICRIPRARSRCEEVEASNREQDGVEDLKLLYARDTDLDNPASAGQHLDDELKRASELYLCK